MENMYTNGIRFPVGTGIKRKAENGTEDIPNKQFYCGTPGSVADIMNSKHYTYPVGVAHRICNESNPNLPQMAAAPHFMGGPPIPYGFHPDLGFKQPEMLIPRVPPPFPPGRHPIPEFDGPGALGPDRGWPMRGRGPMRGGSAGFRGNQWHGGPPRGFYPGRGRAGPSYSQSNQFGGWNQGYQSQGYHPPSSSHYSGSHHKSNKGQYKNKKNKDGSGTSGGSNNREGSQEKQDGAELPLIVEKRRRKNTAIPPFPARPWSREDAEKALKCEIETTRALRNQSLIIRFPDPELTKDIVKKFHSGIQNVHFQVPSGPRYCFVQLSPNVPPEKVIKALENIEFGTGHLTVEKKSTKMEEEMSPESIDPYTLYIGNLPTNVNISTVKEKFPHAARVDVGFAQRMRFTRYAFIRFSSVDDAIKSYQENHNLVLDSRSIIVRFRRQKGQIDLPGETKVQQPSKPMANRQADSKKDSEKDEKGVVDAKKEEANEKDEYDEEDTEEEEEDEEGEEDDSSGSLCLGDDDDDDDDDDERDRKPIQDDDDEDDDDDMVVSRPVAGVGVLAAVAGQPTDADIDPPIIEDDEDDDPENLFRDLDAQLGDFSGFPFNFN